MYTYTGRIFNPTPDRECVSSPGFSIFAGPKLNILNEIGNDLIKKHILISARPTETFTVARRFDSGLISSKTPVIVYEDFE